MDDIHQGGHVNLPCGTVYWMFDEGAYGGITHALHGPNFDSHQDLWGGFLASSYTLVMRPQSLITNNNIYNKGRERRKKRKIKY